MKKIIFILLMFVSIGLSAQTSWQPMFLTVSGNHVSQGVEGWFATGECNGSPVVFLRFVNTNSSQVSLNWYDGVFTQTRQWIYHSRPEDVKSLNIPANSEINGSCSGELLLIINPEDFGINGSDFFRYNAMELNVIY